jgi:hypothetical protein
MTPLMAKWRKRAAAAVVMTVAMRPKRAAKYMMAPPATAGLSTEKLAHW